jgi:hypothetical protein
MVAGSKVNATTTLNTAIAIAEKSLVNLGISEGKVSNFEEWRKGIENMVKILEVEYLLTKEGNYRYKLEDILDSGVTVKLEDSEGKQSIPNADELMNDLFELGDEEGINKEGFITRKRVKEESMKAVASRTASTYELMKEKAKAKWKREFGRSVTIKVGEGVEAREIVSAPETKEERQKRHIVFDSIGRTLKQLKQSWSRHITHGDVYGLLTLVETRFFHNRVKRRTAALYDTARRLGESQDGKYRDIDMRLADWRSVVNESEELNINLPNSYFIDMIKQAVRNSGDQILADALKESESCKPALPTDENEMPMFEALVCEIRERYTVLQEREQAEEGGMKVKSAQVSVVQIQEEYKELKQLLVARLEHREKPSADFENGWPKRIQDKNGILAERQDTKAREWVRQTCAARNLCWFDMAGKCKKGTGGCQFSHNASPEARKIIQEIYPSGEWKWMK